MDSLYIRLMAAVTVTDAVTVAVIATATGARNGDWVEGSGTFQSVHSKLRL